MAVYMVIYASSIRVMSGSVYQGVAVAVNIAISCYVRWIRLAGSLKLCFSFAKEPYKRDYILQKRPVILRSLLIVGTRYSSKALFIVTATRYVLRVHVIYMLMVHVC